MSHFHPKETKTTWLHKLFINIYSIFPIFTLKFYAFIVKFARWPILGKIVKLSANLYGKFLKSGKIITFNEAKNIILKAESCSIGKCRCRTDIYKDNGETKAPINCCIILNYSSYKFSKKYPQDYKHIDKEELVNLVQQFSQKYNLFQNMIYCISPNIYAICNCGKNCIPYRFRFYYGIKEALLAGDYIAIIDENLCKKCKTCEAHCHFEAINDEGISPDKCMGCGLCLWACQNKAISLVKFHK